jgi:hypothetical protein
VASPQSGPWWVLCVKVPVACPNTQRCSRMLTNPLWLVFGCRFKLDNLVLLPSLILGLLQLEDAYPEKLFKFKARLEKTPFTTMGVTKNYVSAAHIDRDVMHSVISWFIRGILYFPSVFLIFPFYQFCFKFILCLCDPFQVTWRMRGNLFSLVLACSSNLDQGPCSFWTLPSWATTRRPS